MARYDDRERRWREEEENRTRNRERGQRENWREQERGMEREGWQGRQEDYYRGEGNDWMTYGRQRDYDRESQSRGQGYRGGREDYDFDQANRMSGGEDSGYGRQLQGSRHRGDWETERDWRGQQDFGRSGRDVWDEDRERGDWSRMESERQYGRPRRALHQYAGSGGRYEQRDFDRGRREDWDYDRDPEDWNRMEAERHQMRGRPGRAPHHFAGSGGRYDPRDFERTGRGRFGGMRNRPVNPYDEQDFDYDYDYDYDEPMGWTYTEVWEIEGPYTGLGPQGYRRSDDRIFEDVCERLSQHGQIDASDIELEVDNGEVVLKGSVDDRRSKRMAEDVAASVSGVMDVQNRLRVQEQQRFQQTGYGRSSQNWPDRERQRGGYTGSHGVQTSRIREQIREGMTVVGSDEGDIGEVKEIHGNEFLVDRPLARDVYVPFDACEHISGDRIRLNVNSGDVNDQGWRNPDILEGDNQ